MKKFLVVATAILILATCFVACACTKEVEPVFITASDESFDFEGKTLVDYMNHIQDNGKLKFEIKDGMVTMVNGTYQAASSYWMIYTNDAENSNEAWGTFEHEGVIYGSAVAGVEELTLKEGCVYILVYQSFGL